VAAEEPVHVVADHIAFGTQRTLALRVGRFQLAPTPPKKPFVAWNVRPKGIGRC
jgi:hypothetical protein